ncbi:hypothetical protein AD006_29250 (plasmid) [Pseudonocardia sp. EC080610-09]|uniref:hypothetical protein n=1 Tax=unclassified Pseudonocardia TaxID=2619320 RepID=UPI0007062BD4|nr:MULTISPECIES: hypothetical protein [unclassified Pseudonocardia]ALL79373.1 hypothetical protein AD006_29250 [Pseudonocardia sp. EC080610-09]ALL85345.1 hypothetical protein AD017_29640 [Pseudonocardia sp. EC080619-01]
MVNPDVSGARRLQARAGEVSEPVYVADAQRESVHNQHAAIDHLARASADPADELLDLLGAEPRL